MRLMVPSKVHGTFDRPLGRACATRGGEREGGRPSARFAVAHERPGRRWRVEAGPWPVLNDGVASCSAMTNKSTRSKSLPRRLVGVLASAQRRFEGSGSLFGSCQVGGRDGS